ncbi:MAG: hypothetical protein ACRD25_03810, partial [Terracidiphilus sp.]
MRTAAIARKSARRVSIRALLLVCFLVVPVYIAAQAAADRSAASSGSQSTAPNQQSQGSGSAAQQKAIKGRNETVVVHGNEEPSYLPESFTLGTLGTEPLKNAPVSATVITRGVMNDQVARLLSD